MIKRKLTPKKQKKLRKTDIDLIDKYRTGKLTARQFETAIAKRAKEKGLSGKARIDYLQKTRRIAAGTSIIHLQRKLLRHGVSGLERKVRPYTVKKRPR